MPGKNGYEVAQYIKQSPTLSHIPVVLLTGAFEPVDQARAAEVGCDGVLAKPFEPQLVIGRVKELLSADAHGGDGRRGGPGPRAGRESGAGRTGRLFRSARRRVFQAVGRKAGFGRKARIESAGGRRSRTRLRRRSPSSVADELDRYVSEHSEGHTPELSLSPEPVLQAAEPHQSRPRSSRPFRPSAALPASEFPGVSGSDSRAGPRNSDVGAVGQPAGRVKRAGVGGPSPTGVSVDCRRVRCASRRRAGGAGVRRSPRMAASPGRQPLLNRRRPCRST